MDQKHTPVTGFNAVVREVLRVHAATYGVAETLRLLADLVEDATSPVQPDQRNPS